MLHIGQGIDFHKIQKKKNSIIKIGGFSIESDYKIIAHSDGDVVLHAVSNAILGATGNGDIGEYFKDSDPKNKCMDSSEILKFCLSKLNKQKIINIDLTIICEKIMFSKHKENIKESLKKLTKCKFVNIKATRFENKRKKLIGCDCILLIN